MGQMLGEDGYKRLKEILDDAETTTRLPKWEEDFLDDLRQRVIQHKERTFVSPRMWEVLERIESKLYGT